MPRQYKLQKYSAVYDTGRNTGKIYSLPTLVYSLSTNTDMKERKKEPKQCKKKRKYSAV